MSTGNPLLDALDRNSAAIATLAAAVKTASPEGVQAAITAGVRNGLGSAPGDAREAAGASKDAVQGIKATADSLTAATVALSALSARRWVDQAKVAGIAGGVGLVFLALGFLGGSWNLADHVDAATAAVRADTANAIAAAKVEAAQAAAWAGTPIGKRALDLDRRGLLDMFATCTGANLVRTKVNGRSTCQPTKDFIGWYLD